MLQVKEAGLFGSFRVVVTSHADRKVEFDIAEITAGARRAVNSQFFECSTVSKLHIGVNQRNLHAVCKGFLLLVAHFRTEIGNERVPAGENARSAAHGTRFSVAD